MYSKLLVCAILLATLASCSKYRIRHHACDCEPVNERFEGGYIFMPNAFTPSSDGVNDNLKVVMDGVSSYRLVVKNRLGQELFDSEKYGNGWGGNNRKGGKAESDNYPYVLEYTTLNGKDYTKTGKVSLIDNAALSHFLSEHCIDNWSDCVFEQQWQGHSLPLKTVDQAQEYFPMCE